MAITNDRKLQGLTTDQLKKLHEAASGGGGYKTKGYDDSNDVSVDYTPTARDYAKGKAINYRHYDPDEDSMNLRAEGTSKNPQWGVVRDSLGIKKVSSEKDLQAMHRAVNQEYMARQIDGQTKGLEDRLSALEGGSAAAPAPEPKAEPEAGPENKIEPKVEIDKIRPFEQQKTKPEEQISGFAGSTWNPEGGTEAPGLAEYSKAKEKAQSFKAGAQTDYSFSAGSYGQKPAATPSGAYGSGDVYGNVTAGDMDAEHKAEQVKNTHITKAKTALSSL